MSVFQGDVQTPLAVKDPGTDYKLPPPRSLNYGGITSETALSSTNGVDTLLVTGNRDRQMNGNESTRIAQNRMHTVQGNQQKQVAGNKTENVVGNFAQTTIGNLHRSIIGATNDLYTAAHAISHKANQMIQEPVTYMHDVKEQFLKNIEHHDEFQKYQLFAANVINVIGLNNDFKLVQTALIGAAAEKAGASWSEHLAKLHDAAVDQRFEALDSKIGAIQPVVHVTMLHEVAITQKILIVGVNQYL
jgi:hypothetical protein